MRASSARAVTTAVCAAWSVRARVNFVENGNPGVQIRHAGISAAPVDVAAIDGGITGLVSDRSDPASVHQIARLHAEPARDLFKMIKLMK